MNVRLAVKLPRSIVCILAAVALLPATQSKSDEPDKARKAAADLMLGQDPGQVRDDNGLKMKLVWCPPGFVTMENVEQPAASACDKSDDDEFDPKEEPASEPRETSKVTPVKVFVTKGYWIGKYEVTQSEWKQAMKTEQRPGADFTREGPDIPVTCISWDEAADFCRKLTEQERQAGRLSKGWEYTLPTEAQWERACRARTETRFSYGDDETKIGDYAWFRDNALKIGESYTHSVGQKKPNPWGIHDMHGNAAEWCRDSFSEKLPGGRDPQVKPDESTAQVSRVVRGGSWRDIASLCRSAHRRQFSSGSPHSSLGFRIVLCAVQ